MRTEAVAQPRVAYPSDITDEEWEVLKSYVPKAKCNKKSGGRPEKYTKREIMNAILHVVSRSSPWGYCVALFQRVESDRTMETYEHASTEAGTDTTR
jgi:transposase